MSLLIFSPSCFRTLPLRAVTCGVKMRRSTDVTPCVPGQGRDKGGADRETACELCGGCFPHPVTFHMRAAHPGCGETAGGKGYNSGGNFCVGWAGNCGDGGVGKFSLVLISFVDFCCCFTLCRHLIFCSVIYRH